MTNKNSHAEYLSLGSASINLASHHCIQSLALRSGLAPILFLEAAQAAKFFVVVRHPLTHVQELESCTSEILLKALRDVSCVPTKACQHALKIRISTTQRRSCAASVGQVGCISMRVVERHRAQRRSSWTLRPDADTFFGKW